MSWPSTNTCSSLGGFTALFTAAELEQQVLGLVLLNSAGQFGSPSAQNTNTEEQSIVNKFIINPVKEVLQRIILSFVFWQSKQPARIESVLKTVNHSLLTHIHQFLFLSNHNWNLITITIQVYINTSNVDDYLVESITKPAGDPNAGEVYYR